MGSARFATVGALCAALWMGCFPKNDNIPLEPYSVDGVLVGDPNATTVAAFGSTDGGYADASSVASAGLDNRHTFTLTIQGPYAVLTFLGSSQVGRPSDEASYSMRADLPVLAEKTHAILSPLSTIAAHRGARTDPNALIESHANARHAVAQAAGLSDLDIAPDVLSQVADPNSEAAKYALVIAGMELYASQQGGASLVALTRALGLDFRQDGVFDGLDAGKAIKMGSTNASPALPADAWATGIPAAMNDIVTGVVANPRGFTAASLTTFTATPWLVAPDEPRTQDRGDP
jgi:hypothetical protein